MTSTIKYLSLHMKFTDEEKVKKISHKAIFSHMNKKIRIIPHTSITYLRVHVLRVRFQF